MIGASAGAGASAGGCSFRSGGTGSNNSFGDTEPAIDGGPTLDAADGSSPSDAGNEDADDATRDSGRIEPEADTGGDAGTDASCVVTVGDFCKDIEPLPGSQV